jgi:hypothetical protein
MSAEDKALMFEVIQDEKIRQAEKLIQPEDWTILNEPKQKKKKGH